MPVVVIGIIKAEIKSNIFHVTKGRSQHYYLLASPAGSLSSLVVKGFLELETKPEMLVTYC